MINRSPQKISNITKKTVLAKEVNVADTFFTRTKGLLGRKEFRKGQALILNSCQSIHTFFMHFPVDVLFVDKNNCIVKTINSLKPFRLTPLYFNSVFTIELPAGVLQDTATQEGDILLFEWA